MYKTLTVLGLLAAGASRPAHAQLAFAPPAITTSPSGYSYGGEKGAASADFNGDGRADIVVSHWCGSQCNNYLQVFLTTATGTLPTPISLPAGLNPQRVIAADVTGDAKPDILQVYASGPVTLYVNQGTGSFVGEDVPVPDTQYMNTNDLQAADFNGDGRLDLLATTTQGVVVLLNTGLTGKSRFAPATSAAVANYANGLQAADLNGDGRADFVHINNPAANHVGCTVKLNNGTGTAFASGLSFTSATPPALGDVDGDGKPDIVVGLPTGAVLYRNLGGGTFGAAVPLGFTLKGEPVLADLDQDGRLDLVASTGSDNGLAVYRNLGAGTFALATTVSAGFFVYHLAVGDANADGRPDVFFAGYSSVGVALNATALAARAPQAQPVALSPNPATDVAYLHLPTPALPAQVALYNTLGQLARRSTLTTAAGGALSVRGLGAGLYTVRVQDARSQWWSARLLVR